MKVLVLFAAIVVAHILLRMQGGGDGFFNINYSMPPPNTPERKKVAIMSWAAFALIVSALAYAIFGGGENLHIFTSLLIVTLVTALGLGTYFRIKRK